MWFEFSANLYSKTTKRSGIKGSLNFPKYWNYHSLSLDSKYSYFAAWLDFAEFHLSDNSITKMLDIYLMYRTDWLVSSYPKALFNDLPTFKKFSFSPLNSEALLFAHFYRSFLIQYHGGHPWIILYHREVSFSMYNRERVVFSFLQVFQRNTRWSSKYSLIFFSFHAEIFLFQ